jgi:hypothetical protein
MKKYLFLIISLLLFSCQKYEEVKSIGETEYYFDEKLSSISLDEDGSFWVGTETGDVINFKDNYRIGFDLAEDRIYKVTRDFSSPGDTLFWIGVRNSGLQLWRKKNNDKLEKLKTFIINFKEDKYSAYDFVLAPDNKIYVGTSQGIYSIDKDSESDSLSLIFPSKEFLSKQNGTTFVVHNICLYNDSLLLASTQGGLYVYNILNQNSQLLFKDYFIDHVSVYNDTIFTVTKGHLYLNNLHGDLLNEIEADNSPKLYYQVQGVHYLVGAEELLLSNDLKEFLRIRLRRTVPVVRSRNVILPDTLNNFTYLLTDNAVWRISNNIDGFKCSKHIKASCSNENNIYYLSIQNELYVQDKLGNEAKWIYTFPENNLIQWMDIIDDELYFYNLDNEFQKMTLSDSWIKNIIFNSPQVIFKPEARITSISIKKMGEKTFSYLGIQDGLVTIDGNNKIDTIPEFSSEYITSMFGHEYTGRLYVSTLNNGVFYISQDKQIKQVPETEDMSFIQDIITTNNHNSNLIMLTNQHIISQNPKDSIRVKGYKKLLYVNDTLFYALPQFGIHKFIISKNEIVDKGIFQSDIHFSPNSSFSTSNQLVLGSRLGSLSLLPNQEKAPQWIVFDKALNINILHSVLLVTLILLLAGFIVVILIKRQNANIVQIKKRKEDLAKRIEDIFPFFNSLGETEKLEIANLKDQINSIDINTKNKNDINPQLEQFSLQIGKLNRRIALLLPKKLEEQIEQIEQTKAFEKSLLSNKSQEVKAQNEIELIKDQIKSNNIWLEQRTELLNALDASLEHLSDCAEIEGVNKYLYNKLISIKNNNSIKPLQELINEYEVVEKEILEINAPHSTNIINTYISETKAYLEEIVSQDKGLSFLLDYLEKVSISETLNDNISLLKNLKYIYDEVTILKNLDKIKSYAKEYKEKHEQIIKDNNEQINKKFDKELASFISDQTQEITRNINTLISSLYDELSEKEAYIIVDILKLSNYQGQHARVLALLISDLKIKRSLISGMLGVYGNLNPVISRLINDRIRTNETLLRELQKSDKKNTVLLHLILRLLE